MFKSTFGGCLPAHIAELEQRFEVALPDDYKQFLLNSNGAQFEHNSFVVPDLGEEINFQVLLGCQLPRSLSIQSFSDEYAEDIPKGSIIIGADACSNFLILDCSDGGRVYYYDHRYLFDGTSDDENTFLLADSFSALLKLVKPL